MATTKDRAIWRLVPTRITSSEALIFIDRHEITNYYWEVIKNKTNLSDKLLSDCFDITEKTFRTLKAKPTITLDKPLQEKTLFIMALIKHGQEVFGESGDFTKWLETENFYFDNKKPFDYLNTISGIKFVDDRLTAMEYGDNV